MAARSKARKRALDILFESEQRGVNAETLLAERLATPATEAPLNEYTVELVQGVVAQVDRDQRAARDVQPGVVDRAHAARSTGRSCASAPSRSSTTTTSPTPWRSPRRCRSRRRCRPTTPRRSSTACSPASRRSSPPSSDRWTTVRALDGPHGRLCRARLRHPLTTCPVRRGRRSGAVTRPDSVAPDSRFARRRSAPHRAASATGGDDRRRRLPGPAPHRRTRSSSATRAPRASSSSASRPAASPSPAASCRDRAEVEGVTVPVGALDITMHRDDLRRQPVRSAEHTDIPAPGIDDKVVVLVDDVLLLRPHRARRARRARPTSAGPAPCGSPCWSTAATASCRSAPTTSARTCPPPAASGSRCGCREHDGVGRGPHQRGETR